MHQYIVTVDDTQQGYWGRALLNLRDGLAIKGYFDVWIEPTSLVIGSAETFEAALRLADWECFNLEAWTTDHADVPGMEDDIVRWSRDLVAYRLLLAALNSIKPSGDDSEAQSQ